MPEQPGRSFADSFKAQALRDGKAVEVTDPAEINAIIADGSTKLWIDLTDPSPAVVGQVAPSSVCTRWWPKTSSRTTSGPRSN